MSSMMTYLVFCLLRPSTSKTPHSPECAMFKSARLRKKEALVQYGKYDVQAIMSQVTNGNGAMPAFGDKLGPDDIEDVANYVYSKADKW